MRATLGLAAILLVGASLAGCQTIQPGTPASYADCDKLIAQYAHVRPDRLNPQEWGLRNWDGMRSAFDRNGDQRLDLAELAHRTQPPADRWERKGYEAQARNFRKLDRGNKGYLDRDDIVVAARGAFRNRDRDRDDWLTRDECAATLPHPIDFV